MVFKSQAPVAHTCNPSYSEAEIRKIVVRGQPQEVVLKPLSWKKPSQKRAGGVVHSVGSDFKPQYHQKKKKKVFKEVLYICF
jgi:hypothetical protein